MTGRNRSICGKQTSYSARATSQMSSAIRRINPTREDQPQGPKTARGLNTREHPPTPNRTVVAPSSWPFHPRRKRAAGYFAELFAEGVVARRTRSSSVLVVGDDFCALRFLRLYSLITRAT